MVSLDKIEINFLTETHNASINYSPEVKTSLENIRKSGESQHRKFVLEHLVKSITSITKRIEENFAFSVIIMTYV